MHFNLEKHHSYFCFSVLTTVDMFYCFTAWHALLLLLFYHSSWFLQFKLWLHKRHLCFCFLTSEKIIRTLLLVFWPLVTIFTAYFEAFRRYIHTLYLACWLTVSKNTILIFTQALYQLKTLQYHVCCLHVCKYVLSTVFCHFNLKMHQPHLSSRSLQFNYTKHNIFLCL